MKYTIIVLCWNKYDHKYYKWNISKRNLMEVLGVDEEKYLLVKQRLKLKCSVLSPNGNYGTVEICCSDRHFTRKLFFLALNLIKKKNEAFLSFC